MVCRNWQTSQMNLKYEATIRQVGGGCKRYVERYRDIDAQFLSVLKEHAAGDPMDGKVVLC
jgi:hypothetical protein